MSKSIWAWGTLFFLLSTIPLGARERTGELAPADVQKDQQEIMKALKDGNQYHMGHLVRKSGLPKVMVVSCADSRVPPEAVFHMKPGQLYVNRAWGNIVDKVILGSLEYGATRLHCPVLVILGHTDCTACQQAIKEHDHPKASDVLWRSLNLEDLNGRLQPAVEAVTAKSLSDTERLDATVRTNVINTMRTIREQSPTLWQLEQGDLLKIVGCVYHLEDGRVEWLKE
jgi:carbonic anhydrase